MKENLTLEKYQKQAITTCMDSCYNISYMTIGAMGELGELASKLAKLIRKEKLLIINNRAQFIFDDDNDEETVMGGLKGELGDIAWFLAGLCTILGFKLEDVAQGNLDKLASRKERGKIDGEGDYR